MSAFSTAPEARRIGKPWGYEILYTAEDLPWTGKILFIRAGSRLSLQYHDEKEEVLCLFSGRATIWLENREGEVERRSMEERRGYRIRVGQRHRIEAVEDSIVLEVSDPETGNTFRLEDDHARGTETEQIRREADRGWSGES
ncbi:hypothetical protein AMJ57_02955 [Parcubacteria bacterium SG8_24]|nr:MAG: hypothetical protein AMJ57_02955 [Parcubacteria bacterium SG8_24]